MKITTVKKHKTKFLRLKLLKTKNFKNRKHINYSLLKNLETRLKKILQVIYRFHIANKKIMFIGTPLKLNDNFKEVLIKKRHCFIPEPVWLNGILTNSKSLFKHLLKQQTITKNSISKPLFNLKNQIDLIVIINENIDLTILKESSLKRIPIISFSFNHSLSTTNLSTYNVENNYDSINKEIKENLFFLLLSSLLRKSELLKKKRTSFKTISEKSKKYKAFNSVKLNVIKKKK